MAENFKVSLELKDVSESPDAAAELMAKGGQMQVPFLVDSEQGVSMYEASDIIDYLREHKTAVASPITSSKPRVHVGGSVCESCEG
jgi:glutathione S-transferase